VDSTLIFISSFMSESKRARLAMRLQGVIGVVVGVLLLSVVFERVSLEWFLSLAAIQAFGAGIAETMVARHSAAVLLASDAASFIIGQCIAVDGGYLASGVNS
jgi:hypothetical protein